MKELGIEPMLLLAQIVNFGIIFFVLKKFLYTPILKMLEKRKREIAESMDGARKIEEEAQKAKDKHASMVAEAKKEVRFLMETAKKQAEGEKRKILADAHTEAAHILARGKAQADAQIKEAEEKLRRQVVDLAGVMVQKLLPEVLSDTDHKKLISSGLKDLEKSMKLVH